MTIEEAKGICKQRALQAEDKTERRKWESLWWRFSGSGPGTVPQLLDLLAAIEKEAAKP